MIMAIPANIMTKHRIWPIEMFKNDLNRAVGSVSLPRAMMKPSWLSGSLRYSRKNLTVI